ETAVLARPEPQRALTRLLEDEAVVDDPALPAAPGGRIFVVDAGPEAVDRSQIVAVRRLDAEQDLAAVGIEPVPHVAEVVRPLGAIGRGARAGCSRSRHRRGGAR